MSNCCYCFRPIHPDSPKDYLGDRVGHRQGRECIRLLQSEIDFLANSESRLEAEVERLKALLNTPETLDFIKAVPLEAAHQRERWGVDHDAGKEPQDWFWLIGYLAGKALAAHIAGNTEKALHHTISSAAALANWHAAILGKTNMRPGIDSTKYDHPTPDAGKGETK